MTNARVCLRWLPLAALWPACTGATVDDVATDEVPDPSPYIYDEEEPPQAVMTPDDLQQAIEQALARSRAATGAPVIEAYAAATAGQQEGCPDYYTNDGNTYWYDYCYADDGSYFSGYGFQYSYDATPDGSGYFYTGDTVYMVAEVSNAQGHTFEGSGSAANLTLDYPATDGGESPPHVVYQSIVTGTFSYDGPEVAGSWMDTELSPDLTLIAYDVPAETSEYWNGRLLSIEGGYSGLEGPASTVVMNGVILFDESLGSSCPIEPSGSVSVRDAEGSWYDVLFDGPEEIGAASDPDRCDGCGAAFFRGQSLGDVCLDFSVALDWEGGAPW